MLHQHASSALQAACAGTPGLSPDLRYEYGPDRPFQPSKRIASHLVAGFGYSLNGKRFVNVPVKYAPILKGREEEVHLPGKSLPERYRGTRPPGYRHAWDRTAPDGRGSTVTTSDRYAYRPRRERRPAHRPAQHTTKATVGPIIRYRQSFSDYSKSYRACASDSGCTDRESAPPDTLCSEAPAVLRSILPWHAVAGIPPGRTRETFGYRHVCGPERLPAHFSHSPCVQTMRIQRTTATAEAPVFSMLT